MKAGQNAHSVMVSGSAARDRGDYAAAETLYRRSLAADPTYAKAHNNLGELLSRQGRNQEAEVHLRRAVELDPGLATAWNNLGNVLARFNSRQAEARQAFESALVADPKHASSLYNYSNLLANMGQPADAKKMLERAVAADPTHLMSLLALHHQSNQQCDWSQFSEHQDSILKQVRRRDATPFTPFPLLAIECTLQDQYRATKRYAESISVPAARRLPPNEPRLGSPIRVGYLSRDYFQHATAALIVEAFEKHDRDKFEIWGVDYSPDDRTPMRKRVLASFDRVLNINGKSDEAAAKAIHDEQIDILVDLKGYTRSTRSQILAYRPAPIQVNYLGYPGTMGGAFVDYILADRVVAPFEHQPFYSERIVHLADCYQPNDRNREVAAPPKRSDYGLPEGAFVFCCFNNTYKISPGVFDIWMRLLKAMPFSVLWLYEAKLNVAANLRMEAEARGVNSERLIFAPPKPMAEHIARYPLADLFLDTLPYNAHTTASEAIWAGLPILTRAGSTFAGRVCASILQAAGLPELITHSAEEYEERALSLARERNQLAAIRSKIADTRMTMPLFDTDRFTAGLEDAYEQMWRLWAEGKKPQQVSAAVPGESRPRKARPAKPVPAPVPAPAREAMLLVLPH